MYKEDFHQITTEQVSFLNVPVLLAPLIVCFVLRTMQMLLWVILRTSSIEVSLLKRNASSVLPLTYIEKIEVCRCAFQIEVS